MNTFLEMGNNKDVAPFCSIDKLSVKCRCTVTSCSPAKFSTFSRDRLGECQAQVYCVSIVYISVRAASLCLRVAREVSQTCLKSKRWHGDGDKETAVLRQQDVFSLSH